MSGKTIYDFKVKDSDGHEVSLEKYRGKVVLIVNVASQCGLTDSNYKEMKPLLEKYQASGFAIAAFPCNQFGGQEPSCELDIRNFIKEKYDFEPDLYAKIEVNGDKAEPLFKFLKDEQGGFVVSAIKWNFTKFLINREGRAIKRYAPTTSPQSIEKDIEEQIKN